jgi:MoaA/NifB/PqqE/SkfB family radical SAM enzyme
MSAERWKQIIRSSFKKQHVYIVTLVGSEPTMRPDIMEVFCEEMPTRVCSIKGNISLKEIRKSLFLLDIFRWNRRNTRQY